MEKAKTCKKVNMEEKTKKLKWISDFLEYELEGRDIEEQKAFLNEFKQQATRLLEKF